MSPHSPPTSSAPRVLSAEVVANDRLCDEHFRLTVRTDSFPAAAPGQFVQLGPRFSPDELAYAEHDWSVGASESLALDVNRATVPLLSRAFSIGGMNHHDRGCDFQIIYRVVGVATTWMASLSRGESVQVTGPLGQPFRIDPDRPVAWLVIGGVGLPPLLWLAQALNDAGKSVVAFLGAATRSLLPLSLSEAHPPVGDASAARLSAREFADVNTPMVISTDDGSYGFGGNVVEALGQFHDANPLPVDDVVVYTCGPERMMQATGVYCMQHGIACQVCMERPMACGTGTCQSCIVPVKSNVYPTGFRYALCCTEGPVFAAEDVVWDEPGQSG